MPPAAARAVTRGRFRVTQEDAAASPAPRDGADDQRVLRGLQHQSTMVLQRLAELEKAVRSQHRGGDEPPREPRGRERDAATNLREPREPEREARDEPRDEPRDGRQAAAASDSGRRAVGRPARGMWIAGLQHHSGIWRSKAAGNGIKVAANVNHSAPSSPQGPPGAAA